MGRNGWLIGHTAQTGSPGVLQTHLVSCLALRLPFDHEEFLIMNYFELVHVLCL